MSDENQPPVPLQVGLRDHAAEGRDLIAEYKRRDIGLSTLEERMNACRQLIDLGVHPALEAKFKRNKDNVPYDGNTMRLLAPSR